jgi:hypothetical protein
MGLISKLKGKKDYLLREITLFGCHPKNINSHSPIEDYNYQEVRHIEDLSILKLDFDSEDFKNRLSQKHVFCCWKDQNKVIAYGWLNPNSQHYLGELALEMDLKSKIEVLYDFYTDNAYRGKGLYPTLLQNMCLRNNKSKLIYAFSYNKSSIRGIEKAGFHLLGKIKGYNKNKYVSLIKDLWEE